MPKFINLEHTADIKIRAYGDNLNTLFQNAAFAMFSQIYKAEVKPEITREIKIKSVDQESLLVDFLSELLTLSDQYNEIYNTFKLEIKDFEIKGEISGQAVKSFDEEIKAVTYHELKITKNKNIWTAEIVFDI